MQNLWIENWSPKPQAQARLFCFPYVGGSAALYRLWPAKLGEQVEVLSVELPGRGRRFGEKLISSLDELVPTFHQAILPYLDKPFFIFGHSMGALIAYEWTLLLEKEGKHLPSALILSAFGAPHVTPPPKRKLHLLSDSEFLEELEHLKGTPKEVLQHRELMSILLPMIRSDLKMVENYPYPKDQKISVPVKVLGGRQDPQVDLSRLEAWKDLAGSSFSLQLFEGEHFFIQSARDRVLESISDEIYRRL